MKERREIRYLAVRNIVPMLLLLECSTFRLNYNMIADYEMPVIILFFFVSFDRLFNTRIVK